MTQEHAYTTGEIIGLTSLKKSSVQRYIRTFKEFFSDQAQLPNRRRRLTSEDVKRLFQIKYLYSIRESKEEIIKSLRGEKINPALAWVEISTALDIASSAKIAAERCEEILHETKKDLHLYKTFVNDNLRKFEAEAKRINNLMAAQHYTLHNWIRVYKMQETRRADDFRYLRDGRLSDSQRQRAINKHMDYFWNEPEEKLYNIINEWEQSEQHQDVDRILDQGIIIKSSGVMAWAEKIAGRIINPEAAAQQAIDELKAEQEAKRDAKGLE